MPLRVGASIPWLTLIRTKSIECGRVHEINTKIKRLEQEPLRRFRIWRNALSMALIHAPETDRLNLKLRAQAPAHRMRIRFMQA